MSGEEGDQSVSELTSFSPRDAPPDTSNPDQGADHHHVGPARREEGEGEGWRDVFCAYDIPKLQGLREALKDYCVNSENDMLRIYNLVKVGDDLEEENVVDQTGYPEAFLAICLLSSMLIFLPSFWSGDADTQTSFFAAFPVSKTIRSQAFRSTLNFVCGTCFPLLINLLTNAFPQSIFSRKEAASSERHVNTIGNRITFVQLAFVIAILVPGICVQILFEYPSSAISPDLFLLQSEIWQLFVLGVSTVVFVTNKFQTGRLSFTFTCMISVMFLASSVLKAWSIPCAAEHTPAICHTMNAYRKAFSFAATVLRLTTAALYSLALYFIFAANPAAETGFSPSAVSGSESNARAVVGFRRTAHALLLRNVNIGFGALVVWDYALIFSEGKAALDQLSINEFEASWFQIAKAIYVILICCTPINLSSARLDAVRNSLRALIADQKIPAPA